MSINQNVLIEVLIDPGHGGKDRFNVGPTTYVEADGVLKISKYLKEEFDRCKKFNTTLTRTVDETLNFTQRTPKKKVNLFISMHTNASVNHNADGAEVIYSVLRPNDVWIARKLSKKFADEFNVKDRGAVTKLHPSLPNRDYFAVLRNSVAVEADHSFIFEPLFHDSTKGEKLLLNDENLKRIAVITAKAFCEYFGVPYISEVTVDNTVTEIFKDAYDWATKRKIVVDSDKILPKNKLPRYNMIVILGRLLISMYPQCLIARSVSQELQLPTYDKRTQEEIDTALFSLITALRITDGSRRMDIAKRQEAYAVLYNIYSNILTNKLPELIPGAMEECSHWAVEYVEWVCFNNISDGKYGTTDITLEQFVQMLFNAHNEIMSLNKLLELPSVSNMSTAYYEG